MSATTNWTGTGEVPVLTWTDTVSSERLKGIEEKLGEIERVTREVLDLLCRMNMRDCICYYKGSVEDKMVEKGK